MSTRASIILKDGESKLMFYRHSDGYPEGTLPTLNRLLEWLKAGKIRSNLSQGAGWLIVLGAMEYQTIPEHSADIIHDPEGWKVGAYEPTTANHWDVEYRYIIDMKEKTIQIEKVDIENDVQVFKAIESVS